MIRWMAIFVAVAGLAACASLAVSEPGRERPNLILIIADDVSWDDIGAYGHPTIHTPVLDRLAEKGMLFTNAYLTASSCSPSRASLITGRYPHNTDAEQLHWPLPPSQITFSEKLMDAGYWTAAAGKWHLGPDVVDRFNVVREAEYAGEIPSGSGDWVNLLQERPDDQPFFLWLAAWDAHRPFSEAPSPHAHSQEDVVLPSYYPATELYLNDFVEYYDEIGRFDSNIGKVVAELEAQGVADNTLIVIISDNGRPYARDKSTLYDSGLKTPFIAYWPKGIDPGQVSDSIISAVDIAPTFLELAKAEQPATLEGQSLISLFEAPAEPFRDYAISERNWHDFEDHGRSVRTAQYRYIRNTYNDLPATPSADTVYHKTWWELLRLYEQGALTEQQARPFRAPRPEEELYDLTVDPLELNNLAGNEAYADVLAEHRVILDNWIEDTGDFVPSVRTPDEFDRRDGSYAPVRVRPRPSKEDMYGKSGPY